MDNGAQPNESYKALFGKNKNGIDGFGQTGGESFFSKLDFVWCAALIFVIIGCYLSWWGLDKIKSMHKVEIANSLDLALKKTSASFGAWEANHEATVLHWARNKRLVEYAEQFLETPRTPKALLASPILPKYRELIAPALESNQLYGSILLSPDYINIATMFDENMGEINVLAKDQEEFLSRLFKGETLMSLPVHSEILIQKKKRVRKQSSMFVGTPVRNEKDRIIAGLVFRIDLLNDFSNFTALVRLGKTGETYIFNENGKFLTPSRFMKEVTRFGLVSEDEDLVLNLDVRDPGGNLKKGFKPSLDRKEQPLTLMASNAISKVQGKNLEGYRNYLGVPVVGAWKWDEERDFGIAIEIAVEEAFQVYSQTKFTLLLILGFAGVMFLVFVVAIARNRERLIRMNRTVIEKSEDLKRKAWITSSLSEFYQKMRGEQDIATLLQNVLGYLAERLNAQIGAFYLKEEEEFRLIGSYAYQRRKNLSNSFRMGEGLVGQAAFEKQDIVVSNAPKDYIQVSSGLGNTPPKNILVAPIVHEDSVVGVLELGALKEFSDVELEMLRQARENLGINIATVMMHEKNQELLQKTQSQARDLQNQQEELRQTNEELERQAKELKESEAQLISQQEELRQTNEELENQARELENQKKEVERKNSVIQEKAEELEVASKYKSEFLANISHELRTPLNSMLILSKILSDNNEGNLSGKQVEFAQTISGAGEDLLSIINDILDLSKVESGKLELLLDEVYLKEFSEETGRNFRHVAEKKGLKFLIETEDELPEKIITDGKRLSQIIKNLLSNAFKFTEKGTVTLKIFRPKPGVLLDWSGLDHSKSVAFSVVDTGKGIAEEKQKVIFEAFQQEDGATNRKFGGTGLGLSISKELARLLGGEIQLKSVLNEGSAFTIFLPEKLEIEGASFYEADGEDILENREDYENSGVSNGIRDLLPISDDRSDITVDDRSLLIIEDDPNFCKILMELAHEKNFKCLIAGTGETGVLMAKKYAPTGIILDIGLPGMDGTRALSKLKSDPATRGIPVHFISAMEEPFNPLKQGAIGFLQKPVSPKKLEEAFARIESAVSKDVKNLLVVEDDQSVQMSVKELLKN